MAFENILYEVKDGIATITLNRPEIFNAMGNAMMHEIIDAFDLSDGDDNVRVVVITGAGKGFCGGADLSKGAAVFDKDNNGSATKTVSARRDDGSFDYSSEAARDGGGRLALRIFASLKPVIGAINGAGVGIGASMLLPMDIRIASEKARLGFVYARRGIVFECCSSWFLPRIVGIAKALELSFSGRVLGAAELKDAGLVSQVVAPEELLPTTYAVAREIADNTAPVSVALMRQMAWRSLGMSHPMEAHRIESRGICTRGASPDAKEGITSFLEKRLPEFAGKVSTDMPNYFPWWEEPQYS
ncbi:crotonase/enoyl-CoA hydratase family protein [Sphingobium sp. JS3065]|uniref:crotonase/enoyl-CoA hydratase family protein n=1 Tax=Sphingobium sp. JS3065 TaxID=2970925 RepID=UPI0022648161|nr:crotonase/enoyl-CoA hydratase family protein [Sphingobium sp. JS3065]UZW57404.1 crotonase/enoyl-CoA hydratase family protein [Sphingobium sp. JS3065]